MKKTLLSILFLAALASAPLNASASESEAEDIEVSVQDIRIILNGNMLHISNANGETLRVYDIAGNIVQQTTVDSSEKQIALSLRHGVYIVRVGGVARKIQIK